MAALPALPSPVGVACIALSFVDPHGRPLQAPAQDDGRPREVCPFRPQLFDELTTVSKVHAAAGSCGPGDAKGDQPHARTHTHRVQISAFSSVQRPAYSRYICWL